MSQILTSRVGYPADNAPVTASQRSMPLFHFQVQQGKRPGPFALDEVLSDNAAARKVALGLCADLAKDIVPGLTDDSEWRLDVSDEFGKPVFTIRLLAESLQPLAASLAHH
jgi:hypothetical protein